MCWCWSDKPQHRPSFNEVLHSLRTDTFTHLLAATPITKDSDEITAAAVRTSTTARRLSASSLYSRSTCLDSTSVSASSSVALTGVMSLLSSHSPYGEDIKVEVWYGTENGACGIAQFQKTGMTTEVCSCSFMHTLYMSVYVCQGVFRFF